MSALSSARPAFADAESLSGVYQNFATPDGGGMPVVLTWTFTPCGPGCATANGDWQAHDWQFRLVNGQWSYSGQIVGRCGSSDGTVPEIVHVNFDAVTLAGAGSLDWPEGCGTTMPPGTSIPYTYQLTKSA